MRPHPDAADPVDRAHLTGASAPSPPVLRYAPSPRLADLVRRYWVPVWDLPDGVVWGQRVLQYPVCLLVVAHDYARCYGVATGRSGVDLSGRGWAVGAMLQPAAGRLVWGAPVTGLTDRHVDLREVPGIDGAALVARVRAAMATDPADPDRHRAAIAAMEDALAHHLPVDAAGHQLNALVERVESDRDLTRVDDLARVAALGERQLQRLVRDRLGLTPKWLIQRRRLHDAVEALKAGGVALGELAADLGYTDQAHFTRDFTRATGTPPGAFLADQ